MRIGTLAIGNNPPEDLNVIIEVQIGREPSEYKLNKKAGALYVDRFLHAAMRYPGVYGFVTYTLSKGGDALDVLWPTPGNVALLHEAVAPDRETEGSAKARRHDGA